MSDTVLPVLIFAALPASGKSESRNFLKSLPAEETARFHLGDSTTQLDDYPYVHLMREVDVALKSVGLEYVFFIDPRNCLRDERDWGTLIELLNEDYEDLLAKPAKITPEHPAIWALERYDQAGEKCGIPARFRPLFANPETREKALEAAEILRAESQTLLDDKWANIPESLEGKTIVCEFARGGAKDHGYPLLDPMGYQYSFRKLSPAILKQACVLYVWVTPEQSYAKNVARAQEKVSQTKSTQLSLNHGVPHTVMVTEYGCDDMDYLLSISDIPNTVRIEREEGVFHLPVGRFDNREDLTTPFRKAREDWTPEDIGSMKAGMDQAFADLLGAYQATHK
eukprot:gnl/Dysnectes_brevis/773_a851_5219.p1 GENE.gnl/Dysnectes_brevis/773_a851_5219~~gnl/Dysnectes_brevis/773_a851_5219.p1  ORF type:complete len:340 (+),score=162.06 gnl/Dysnectes_brevis/773_a851_5219:92-1111(+)